MNTLIIISNIMNYRQQAAPTTSSPLAMSANIQRPLQQAHVYQPMLYTQTPKGYGQATPQLLLANPITAPQQYETKWR
jgi:hypothetical protein